LQIRLPTFTYRTFMCLESRGWLGWGRIA